MGQSSKVFPEKLTADVLNPGENEFRSEKWNTCTMK
jgi:hypothetical protein